jgi:hypothetical protein
LTRKAAVAREKHLILGIKMSLVQRRARVNKIQWRDGEKRSAGWIRMDELS